MRTCLYIVSFILSVISFVINIWWMSSSDIFWTQFFSSFAAPSLAFVSSFNWNGLSSTFSIYLVDSTFLPIHIRMPLFARSNGIPWNCTAMPFNQMTTSTDTSRQKKTANICIDLYVCHSAPVYHTSYPPQLFDNSNKRRLWFFLRWNAITSECVR